MFPRELLRVGRNKDEVSTFDSLKEWNVLDALGKLVAECDHVFA
jgi:hypothetical protein